MGMIQDRLVADMKAGQKDRVQVVRMLIAGLKDEQLRSGSDDLSEDAELAVLRKAAKARREAVEQARELGREDVAEVEGKELAICEEYLPATLSGDALGAKVREVAEAIGYAGPKDTGRFMKEWMSKHKGLAEGRDVQAALKRL